MSKREESPGEFVWITKLKLGKAAKSTKPYGQIYVPTDLLELIGWEPGQELHIIIASRSSGDKKKVLTVFPHG